MDKLQLYHHLTTKMISNTNELLKNANKLPENAKIYLERLAGKLDGKASKRIVTYLLENY